MNSCPQSAQLRLLSLKVSMKHRSPKFPLFESCRSAERRRGAATVAPAEMVYNDGLVTSLLPQTNTHEPRKHAAVLESSSLGFVASLLTYISSEGDDLRYSQNKI